MKESNVWKRGNGWWGYRVREVRTFGPPVLVKQGETATRRGALRLVKKASRA